MKAVKTFKIGEYAVGGIVRVVINGDHLIISALDWGDKGVVEFKEWTGHWPLSEVELWIESEITTSYYAGKIVDWVKSKYKK